MEKRKKIAYIISLLPKRALEFEWVAEKLDRTRFELVFILLNPTSGTPMELKAQEEGWCTYHIQYTGKKQLPQAIYRIWQILGAERPQAVHTHLVDATMAGLVAAWLRRIPQRIYTRHHSTFHHDYQPHAVYYDLLCNRLATQIVAIAPHVREVLEQREGVSPSKIVDIPHCLDTQAFLAADLPQRIQQLKVKYGLLDTDAPVVGIVSRYTEWKGIQYSVPAFERFLADYPNAKLVLANARAGEYVAEIDKLLARLPKDRYVEIEFEPDMPALFGMFDLFVHTPIDAYCEAFGQIYLEALMAQVPSVVTASGIAHQLVKNGDNALLVLYQDTESVYRALLALWQDKAQYHKIQQQGHQDVIGAYTIPKKIDSLAALYLVH